MPHWRHAFPNRDRRPPKIRCHGATLTRRRVASSAGVRADGTRTQADPADRDEPTTAQLERCPGRAAAAVDDRRRLTERLTTGARPGCRSRQTVRFPGAIWASAVGYRRVYAPQFAGVKRARVAPTRQGAEGTSRSTPTCLTPPAQAKAKTQQSPLPPSRRHGPTPTRT